MTLKTGTKLDPYEILSRLGAGGMGEVYLARDGKLDRQVAIKVLHESMTRDPERIARFEREAKLLASLNHPNIAAIYGFDESNGTRFLVMEYVKGETLAQRLEGGAFAVEDALDVAKQMAEALEAAHEKGVIHRDLKPGNVMIRPEGTVKVLDFGLAKAMAEESPAQIPADSPTITANYTRPGVVLGTAAYMSPEQARGRPLDKRTDIWSFGLILYECLTGRLLFRGETAADSMGAIMHREPDWSALPTETPPTVRLLLRRCLQKDRKRRLHDIADARIELDEAIGDPENSALDLAGAATQARRGTSRVLLILAPLVVLAAFTGWQLKPQPEPPNPVLRKLEIQVDAFPGEEFLWPIISPDGSRIAYVAKGSLWVRALDDLAAVELGGTEGATLPFWSPGSSQLGFHSDTRLWRIPATGGARTMICVTHQTLSTAGGAAWTADDRVVFTSAAGGRLLGGAGRRRHASGHNEPRPGSCPGFSRRQRVAGRKRRSECLAQGQRGASDTIILVRNGSFETLLEHPGEELFGAVYANGYILYERVLTTSTIWAAPFSLESKEVTAASFLVAESAERPSVSGDGTLVYAPSTYLSAGQLVWVDRTGAITKVSGAGESHPRALPEPDVSLSTHPAPIIPSPYGTMPSCQCANNSGLLRAMRRSH